MLSWNPGWSIQTTRCAGRLYMPLPPAFCVRNIVPVDPLAQDRQDQAPVLNILGLFQNNPWSWVDARLRPQRVRGEGVSYMKPSISFWSTSLEKLKLPIKVSAARTVLISDKTRMVVFWSAGSSVSFLFATKCFSWGQIKSPVVWLLNKHLKSIETWQDLREVFCKNLKCLVMAGDLAVTQKKIYAGADPDRENVVPQTQSSSVFSNLVPNTELFRLRRFRWQSWSYTWLWFTVPSPFNVIVVMIVTERPPPFLENKPPKCGITASRHNRKIGENQKWKFCFFP